MVFLSAEPGSSGALADLREGDLIKEVNRKEIYNADDFRKAMAKSGADKDAQMLVRRGKHTRYVIIEAKPAVQQPPTPKIVDVELSGAKGRILNIKLLILC